MACTQRVNTPHPFSCPPPYPPSHLHPHIQISTSTRSPPIHHSIFSCCFWTPDLTLHMYTRYSTYPPAHPTTTLQQHTTPDLIYFICTPHHSTYPLVYAPVSPCYYLSVRHPFLYKIHRVTCMLLSVFTRLFHQIHNPHPPLLHYSNFYYSIFTPLHIMTTPAVL